MQLKLRNRSFSMAQLSVVLEWPRESTGRMAKKICALIVGASLVTLVLPASAQTYIPRYGGGYNVKNPDGTSSATITPRYGGG